MRTVVYVVTVMVRGDFDAEATHSQLQATLEEYCDETRKAFPLCTTCSHQLSEHSFTEDEVQGGTRRG